MDGMDEMDNRMDRIDRASVGEEEAIAGDADPAPPRIHYTGQVGG
jgi:hypothetical protein